jgi:hypothetical protein
VGLLEPIWEEGLARVGELGAKGWGHYLTQPQAHQSPGESVTSLPGGLKWLPRFSGMGIIFIIYPLSLRQILFFIKAEEEKGDGNDWEEEVLASLGEKEKVGGPFLSKSLPYILESFTADADRIRIN